MAGIGPVPWAGMMLADLGADVVRIDRAVPSPLDQFFGQDPTKRSRRSLALDLKQREGVEVALRAIERAQILIEGFRPGVMERLGLGPALCLERNPGLVYGRMTGWGQAGLRARTAGHDLY
ncbi:MAG: CoA transferase, partial [Acidimicrobiia bacterium]